MNKSTIAGLVLIVGQSCPALAKTGVAEGGFELMLSIIGFLLLVAGLLAAIGFLKENGWNLFQKFRMFLKRKISIPWNSD